MADMNMNAAPMNQAPMAPVKYAGFWRRFTAWLIDLLILIIISHWASLPLNSTVQIKTLSVLSGASFFSSGLVLILLLGVVIDFIIIALYYCLLEASQLQATVGKYIVGIQITDMDGQRIKYGKAFLRRICAILSTLLIFIGYIIAGFTPKKQTLHDILAKTVVTVKHKRNGFTLLGIIILTIVIGILSDMFLGAGFHFSFNSPKTHYDTQNGLSNYIVETGDTVATSTRDAVITAFVKKKALFATGDQTQIRQYFSENLSDYPSEQQEALSQFDSDPKDVITALNNIFALASPNILSSSTAEWTFNDNETSVKISFPAVTSSGVPITASVGMAYNNGQWY